MTKKQLEKYVVDFNFSDLFRNLGWDNFVANHKIDVQDSLYTLTGIAQKRNFPILQCEITNNKMPDLNIRKQFEKQVRKLYLNHLIVFNDTEQTWQHWQLPLREDGKLTKIVSFSWHKGQNTEGLFQKLRNLVFSFEEEDIITLADVEERVNTLSANSEKVIKKFYAEFTILHQAFLKFIKGIEDALPDDENGKKQWYASLMLNRLMFCYFIQKKGFLDWNVHYLREKLAECKKLTSKNNFYGFYRSFLLELFHDELGRPEDKRPKPVSPVPFGTIPYLNGGLFDLHELETDYKKISIKDEAFENIFVFFDKWEWHLDTRITASGKDINPDVIGYIFEKFINQKEMGAYYTKEDITGYIGKNTIIPFLLDKVKSYRPELFASGSGFWQYLQDSGDEYIYDSVKKGAEGLKSLNDVNIPENIRIGIDTTKPNLLERRKDWNTATLDEIGLPTEIWRETITRLQRYFELKTKIMKGGIQEINDLITYNLNILKLVQDYLEQTQDKEFIRNFHTALCRIKILDPTCGSGAFLFAALNILEPLYTVCIHRIEEFYNANPKRNKDFEDRLAKIEYVEHPNLTYYIFKTIILNNLYGVDLMKEAVEIAKLRLFLKLVAEVDPLRKSKNYGLEPLPDIDFNIRSGNTLVGFATEEQLEEVVRNTEGDLIYKEKLDELKSACKNVAESFKYFQLVQTSLSSNTVEFKKEKKALSDKLKELDEKLNRYLADTYGLGAQTQWKSKKEKENAYQEWKESHRPFHWFAEFYEIIRKGGFDVVIGNPPYVELKGVNYKTKNYETVGCGDLYALIIERAISLLNNNSKIGMIVPVSIISTDGFKALKELLSKRMGNIWYSSYSMRPAKLFEGVEKRLSIFLSEHNSSAKLYSTKYHVWSTEYRDCLFDTITYNHINGNIIQNNSIPKINTSFEVAILEKIKTKKAMESYFLKESNHIVYHTRKLRYFVQFLDTPPKIYDEKGKLKVTSELKELHLENDDYRLITNALYLSTLFFWYYISFSDCRNLNKREILSFQCSIDEIQDSDKKEIIALVKKLLKNLQNNSHLQETNFKEYGMMKTQIFNPRLSKPIIDEIDKVLAKHYGFTDEELDFIINYDIKYRMGSELEGEG
jgi:hypothetical protein